MNAGLDLLKINGLICLRAFLMMNHIWFETLDMEILINKFSNTYIICFLMYITLLELFKKSKLNLSEVYLQQGSGDFPSNNLFNINASDFLRFAKQDYYEGETRGLINAVTNAKRAIDCQVDTVLKIFGVDILKGRNPSIEGFLSNFQSTESNFKMKLIEALNLAPSFIVNETRLIRHHLEHFYKEPNVEDVKRSIDVASLFVDAVQGKFRGIMTDFAFANSPINDDTNVLSPYISIIYNLKERQFNIETFNSSGFKCRIDSKDETYYSLLRLIISPEDEMELNLTFKILIKQIDHPSPVEKAKIYVVL